MKKYIISSFFLFFFNQAYATVLNISYFPHIDAYHFLENLSEWSPDYTIKSYKQYWNREKLHQSGDEEHLENIKKIRLKYYCQPKERFFSFNDKEEDKIKYAFLNSKSYNETYQQLARLLSKSELEQFDECYQYFLARINSAVQSGKGYQNIIEKLNKENNTPEMQNYFKKIRAFYRNKNENNILNIYVVWQPEEGNSGAYYINKNIVLGLKASTNRTNLSDRDYYDLLSVLYHEMMHYHSSMMDAKINFMLSSMLKESLGLNFNNQPNLGKIIEEPLAVILGQRVFLRKYRNKYYYTYDNFYQNDWINLMALIAEPLVEEYMTSNREIDKEFIEQYSKLSLTVIHAASMF